MISALCASHTSACTQLLAGVGMSWSTSRSNCLQAASSREDDADFGRTLTSIKSKADYEKAIGSDKAVVVRACCDAVAACPHRHIMVG
jgi:hypothetical protein